MYEIIKIDDQYIDILKEFCSESKKLGYNNNASLENLKFNIRSDLEYPAEFWGVKFENKLISLAGCHQLDDKILRCLFRGANLPNYKVFKSLNANHMNSLAFSLLLPLQIFFGLEKNLKEFVITTTASDNDDSGKMQGSNRILSLLSKKGIVDFVETKLIFNIPQNIWKINLHNYHFALIQFDKIRSQIVIEGFKEEYEHIKKYGFRI